VFALLGKQQGSRKQETTDRVKGEKDIGRRRRTIEEKGKKKSPVKGGNSNLQVRESELNEGRGTIKCSCLRGETSKGQKNGQHGRPSAGETQTAAPRRGGNNGPGG